MFEVAAHLAALLILAAFVAGFVDSIAGGGGLIAMPMLLIAGASPLEALATNKLRGADRYGFGGNGVAAFLASLRLTPWRTISRV